MVKSYQELRRLPTFEDRFEYLKIGGVVGRETFGFERYLNQTFYHSSGDWRHTRRDIIIRDNGCDLAIPDREILDRIIVHHINPITVEDIELSRDCVLDPDNLICVSHNTSNAIHYGDASLLVRLPKERRKGDTYLWLPQAY
jgi:hypothetical protein